VSEDTISVKKIDDGVWVFAALLAIIGGFMFLSPSLTSGSGDDWISMPLVGLPIIAGLLMISFGTVVPPWRKEKILNATRYTCLAISLMSFAICTGMFVGLFIGVGWDEITFNHYVVEAKYNWIDSIGVYWHVGLDGLSFPMVWLTSLLIPITIVTTWNEKRGWYYHPLLLVMGGALIGVFVSLDLFMFYVFWELTLVPMFFLILNWGGADRRYAAQKFFIYTFTASIIMLLGILILYFAQTPDYSNTTSFTGRTFDMYELTRDAHIASIGGTPWLGLGLQKLLFVMFAVGFLVKLPVVPFHTWLPDAHVQAPTGGSMLLAGVMLKMGSYGFFRICIGMFPDALIDFQTILMLLGMLSIFYGAWACLGQTNLKRMVAYSSVSHMGLILLGIASMQPLGFAGALFMMFAHGIISPLLFAVAGSLKHHYHTLEIGSMRGLAKWSPWMGAYMMFGWMASLGLPLLAGFVAEVAIMVAFWQQYGWWVLIPALTLIITAAYYLWSMQRIIFEGGEEGQLPESLGEDKPVDIDKTENIGMLIMAVLTVLFGILPFIMFDMMSAYSSQVFDTILKVVMVRRGL